MTDPIWIPIFMIVGCVSSTFGVIVGALLGPIIYYKWIKKKEEL